MVQSAPVKMHLVKTMQDIRTTGKLEQDTEHKLKKALEVYTENFLSTRPEK